MTAPASTAKATFDAAIADAEQLLVHFNRTKVDNKPPPPSAEVLKRSTLIMAMTAWETYVEDRVRESLDEKLAKTEASLFTRFVKTRLEEELKRFHNPDSQKTAKLFKDYLEVEDVTSLWSWNGYEPGQAREKLDFYLKKRGDAVHRAKTPRTAENQPQPHLVNQADLEKLFRFLKSLVEATERAVVA